jgi:hypothetical protein
MLMRRTALARLLLVVPLLALAACGDGGGGEARTVGPAPGGSTPEEPIELSRSGGCAEAFLWAATEDGTVAITVGVEVPRFSTTDPVTIDLDVPDPAVEATLLRADADMTRNFCVDVIEADAEPDETIPLTAGTGEVVIGPIPTDVSHCG